MADVDVAREIIDAPADDEVGKAYLRYSMSVVYSRAIPSIDGLKPVQRRILYGMFQQGWTHDKPYVKVSRAGGEVMGVYHPHGNTSIEDAIVKLGQSFYLNTPLIDGYGNFGDITGSEAAAARYIECRLSKAAQFVLREMREDVVDMRPNYDGTGEEPVLLPIMFPTLLVNGNFGIGVGFSAKIAPHNPTEVIDGTKFLLKNPDATLKQVMKYIPGPDFPTGAELIGMEAIQQAYETGNGLFRIRSKVEIIPQARGRNELVFTELPYGVSTELVVETIKKKLAEGRLQGVADAEDFTDKDHGLRLVITTKPGSNAQAVLAELYKETKLEDSFSINNTVLVEGSPKSVGLIEMLQIFLAYRQQIVVRRSTNRRQKRLDRLHLQEGLLKSLANIDEVIRIVRTSADAAAARTGLMKKFKLDEIQADYILEIPLRRLTKYDSIQLDEEIKRLREEIKDLTEIIDSPERRQQVILDELDEVRKVIAAPRRSKLIGGTLAEHMAEAKEAVAAASVPVADTATNVVLYADGTLSQQPDASAIKALKARGKVNPVIASVTASTGGRVLLVTNKGRGYKVDVLHLTENPAAASTLTSLSRGEKVLAIAPLGEELGAAIFFATASGTVKLTNPDYPLRSDDFDLISADANDEIISARWVSNLEGGELVFVSSDASLLRVDASKVRPQGRTGGGVAGMSLASGAKVLAAAFVQAEEKDAAQVVNYTGQSMKVTPLNVYPVKGRATGGVRSIAFLKGETELKFSAIGVNPIVIGSDGKQVTLPPVNPKRDGSGLKTLEEPAASGW